MAQPYDYSINIPNPTTGFLQGMQIGQELRKREVDAQKAEAAAQRAQLFRQRLTELQNNPSPDQIDKLYFEFPEMKEQLDVFSTRVSARDKRTYGDFARRAIIARQGGASNEEVAKIYQEGADIAQKSGRNDLAAQFLDASKTAANPVGSDDLAARMLMYQVDPDGYKVIYEQSSNLDKDYALNVRLYGKDQADALRLAQETAKGFVTASGPAGSTFTWAPTLMPRTAAGSAAGGTGGVGGIPAPKTEAEYNALPAGAEYIAPNGQRLIKGGSAARATAPSRQITEQEAMKIRANLGGAKFSEWLRQNNIAIVGK